MKRDVSLVSNVTSFLIRRVFGAVECHICKAPVELDAFQISLASGESKYFCCLLGRQVYLKNIQSLASSAKAPSYDSYERLMP